MEVMGVLMSWETFVMSSVFRCSDFIRSSTARCTPGADAPEVVGRGRADPAAPSARARANRIVAAGELFARLLQPPQVERQQQRREDDRAVDEQYDEQEHPVAAVAHGPEVHDQHRAQHERRPPHEGKAAYQLPHTAPERARGAARDAHGAPDERVAPQVTGLTAGGKAHGEQRSHAQERCPVNDRREPVEPDRGPARLHPHAQRHQKQHVQRDPVEPRQIDALVLRPVPRRREREYQADKTPRRADGNEQNASADLAARHVVREKLRGPQQRQKTQQDKQHKGGQLRPELIAQRPHPFAASTL